MKLLKRSLMVRHIANLTSPAHTPMSSLRRIQNFYRVNPFLMCVAALAEAQALPPDLILMDVMMPLMSGWEAARRMRQIPTLRKVPILAVSASTSSHDEAKSLAAGANAFLPKPIQLDKLLEDFQAKTILELVGRHLEGGA